ncbi:MAG TPA: FxLYD domain-containing protein, partial [Methylomirabilota bacterium]|nr:FxLYD domain-containing protein [Methylomirabilota bacterium]
KPAIEGTVTNISPYDIANVRILVDTLDAAGQITSQQVAWLPGDIRGGGRLYFQVPTPPAPAYRVRVFTYDRIESTSNQR